VRRDIDGFLMPAPIVAPASAVAACVPSTTSRQGSIKKPAHSCRKSVKERLLVLPRT
jgi:hypothetical protein